LTSNGAHGVTRPTNRSRIDIFDTGLNRIFFRERFSFSREEAAVFEKAAEIFFAGVAMFAFIGGETFEDFVGHLEPFEMNDADVLGAVFPDLPLLKFQCHVDLAKTVSPD
jgi:hypothetical protein